MDVEIRGLTVDDVELICFHRAQMFLDAGVGEETVGPMIEHFGPWLEPRLRDGSYFGYVATFDGLPVASVGLMVIEWPPHPLHPSDHRRGYILNMFVVPSHRRQGLGRRLMELADQRFQELGVSLVVLHATEKGQKLYRTLGWSETSEMVKRLAP